MTIFLFVLQKTRNCYRILKDNILLEKVTHQNFSLPFQNSDYFLLL